MNDLEQFLNKRDRITVQYNELLWLEQVHGFDEKIGRRRHDIHTPKEGAEKKLGNQSKIEKRKTIGKYRPARVTTF